MYEKYFIVNFIDLSRYQCKDCGQALMNYECALELKCEERPATVELRFETLGWFSQRQYRWVFLGDRVYCIVTFKPGQIVHSQPNSYDISCVFSCPSETLQGLINL